MSGNMTLAYDLIARDKGASKTLDGLGDSVDKTGQKASKLGDMFKVGLAGVAGIAAAAGTALVAGLFEQMDREAGADKLAASLGLTPEDSKRLGGVAGDLYADAYGESLGDVNAAVGAVVSSIDGMRTASDADLQAMTAKALDFAATFDVDVPRAVQVAGQVMRTGLAKDGTEAFDLLVTASQQVPAAIREDLFDAVDEYGQFFASMGYSGREAFALLVDASEDGMYGIDKMGDAVKEFTIRATDGSKLTSGAYKELGLDTEDMTNKLLAGGESARTATQQIVDGLLGIKDPGEQAATAIALFGTPLEDLNVTEIPAFLEQMSMASGELENVAGAADRMGDTLNDNAKTNIEGYKRKAQEVFVDFIGNQVIPMIERNKDEITDFGLVVGEIAAGAAEAILRMGALFLDNFARNTAGLRQFVEAMFVFAENVLAAADTAFSWVPFVGDKIDSAKDKVAELRVSADGNMAAVEEAFAGAADGARKAADAAGSLRDKINEIQSKRVTVTVDYQQVGSITSVPYQKRALGGPVSAGSPYLVGEQGPELVVPSQSGTVIPAGRTTQMLGGGGDIERLVRAIERQPIIVKVGEREIFRAARAGEARDGRR